MLKKILVVDLEATCSDDGSITSEEMEIIEIGACWATESGVVLQRFQHYQWVQGHGYHYILIDSGEHFYQCLRCGKTHAGR